MEMGNINGLIDKPQTKNSVEINSDNTGIENSPTPITNGLNF